MKIAKLMTAAIGVASVVCGVASCSLGGGNGAITGTLDVVDCWSGNFNLQPDFFAAEPYNDQMMIRIQNGSDYENFSDGLQIAIDDVSGIRANSLGKPIAVALPPSVTPPGVPIQAIADPALVHFSLYLQRTCRLETPALYATRAVSLNADGSCGGLSNSTDAATSNTSMQCGATDPTTDAGTSTTDAGALPTATSTITFANLFDGNPDESNAVNLLTDAKFDVYLADPREVCPGGLGPPPRCRGHLTGSFRFYFQRGRPAQPFP